MWPCISLDWSWSDFCYAVGLCLRPSSKLSREIEFGAESATALPVLSVRSAFDLYLQARSWEEGDECVFIGINVPDMFSLAATRGLKVVCVDVDPLTTIADMEELRSQIRECTRFVVVPHLFGCRVDISSIINIAKEHEIDVIEDCAQAFAGNGWSGTPDATISLFSFGPLKTATAMQGGVAVIRERALRDSMRELIEAYPPQTTTRYFLRVLRFSWLKLMTGTLVFNATIRLLEWLAVDHEKLIHQATKSASGSDLIPLLHQKPCSALVQVMAWRIKNSGARLEKRKAVGEKLESTLAREVQLVLREERPHCYWMVPVLTSESYALKVTMLYNGFYAMSSRLVVPADSDCEGAWSLANAVCIPFSPNMPRNEIERLAELCSLWFKEIQAIQNRAKRTKGNG